MMFAPQAMTPFGDFRTAIDWPINMKRR